eukprot:SAG22_NODE_1005_length_6077_cov_3.132653_6_plen_63_part_00
MEPPATVFLGSVATKGCKPQFTKRRLTDIGIEAFCASILNDPDISEDQIALLPNTDSDRDTP